eukprot:m.140149 g.140149  ORF g.140149 m.140149 type:complete len:381 (-) comp16665_c0_seq2:1409-2551(-)
MKRANDDDSGSGSGSRRRSSSGHGDREKRARRPTAVVASLQQLALKVVLLNLPHYPSLAILSDKLGTYIVNRLASERKLTVGFLRMLRAQQCPAIRVTLPLLSDVALLKLVCQLPHLRQLSGISLAPSVTVNCVRALLHARSSLTSLSLDISRATAAWIPVLAQLQRLGALTLMDPAVLPPTAWLPLRALTSLRTLRVTGGNFSGLQSLLPHLKGLTSLELTSVDAKLPTNLGSMLPQLTQLRLLNMGLTSWEQHMPNLKSLDLSFNPLQKLGNLAALSPQLTTLNINSTFITDESMGGVASLQMLATLILESLFSLTDASAHHIATLKSLVKLDVSFTDYGMGLTRVILDLPRITDVRWHGCPTKDLLKARNLLTSSSI